MDIEYVNMGTSFIEFYEKAKEDPNNMMKYYSEIIIPLSKGYDKLLHETLKERYEKHIENSIKKFDLIKDAFAKYSQELPDIIESSTLSFKNIFSDFEIKDRVFVVNSFGMFDGAVRTIDGRKTLCFGLDVISRIHNGREITPLIHHELFHLYHYSKYELLNQVWEAFYAEGLAIFIAHKMNPDADAHQLLLTIPTGLIEKVDINRKYLRDRILEELDGDNEEEFYNEFFTGPFSEERYRAGYYIGYLFCHYLAKSHSIGEMLNPDKLKYKFRTFIEGEFIEFPTFDSLEINNA